MSLNHNQIVKGKYSCSFILAGQTEQNRLNGSVLFPTDIYIFAGGIPSDGNLEEFTVGTGGKHYFKLRSYELLDEAFDQIFGELSLSQKRLVSAGSSHSVSLF